MNDPDATQPVRRSSDSTTLVAAGAALLLGAIVWMATMGSAERYSQGPDLDEGTPGALVLGLGTVAMVLGLVAPKRPILVGALVTAAPLLLAPATAPRGDGDGLWVLIFPML